MALAKIAGLEVTPPRPSSSTIRLSSPPTRMLRRMKSSHTDCPYCCSDASGFEAAAVRTVKVPIPSPSQAGPRARKLPVSRLDRLDLGQPPRVALLGRVARLDERLDQLVGEDGADHASAQH